MGDEHKTMTISVGRIAKIMAGTCPYAVWMDIRHPRKEEDERLEKWRQQHDQLVSLFIDEFQAENPGWVVVTEHSLGLQGITGRIDVLCRGRGNKFQIWEIKTGKEYPYHQKQLGLYMALMKKKNPQALIQGHLKYIDGEPLISNTIDAESMLQEATDIKNLLETDTPPQKKYCVDCKWCTYKEANCPLF
jgi:CRISPR/Cas system-associated exonuclease Cas4 (RecB family)